MAKRRKKKSNKKKKNNKILKYIVIIIFLLIILYVFYNYLIADIILLKSQKLEGQINDYYIYGTHLNVEGSINIDNSNVTKKDIKLILSNGYSFKNIKSEINIEGKKAYFSFSDEINSGLNLEKLKYGNWYLFIKINNNYYSLKDVTGYKSVNYYTITKKNSNNNIKTKSGKKYNHNYFSIVVRKSTLPKDVYDITIDPGHGGIDTGSYYNINGKTYYESDIVYEISLKAKKLLEEKGYKVLLTRNSNDNLDYYGKNGRATLPNKYKTKLSFSIHLNSDYGVMNYGGVEVYIPNDCNTKFAKSIAQSIVNITGVDYSKKINNKLYKGVYYNYYDSDTILEKKIESVNNGYEPYDIQIGAPEMYMIREVGGKATMAYIDGRVKEHGKNPYFNSNQTAESYLIEMGYISYKEDLYKLIDNPNSFARGLIEAISDYLK